MPRGMLVPASDARQPIDGDGIKADAERPDTVRSYANREMRERMWSYGHYPCYQYIGEYAARQR
jgi:hypothetical protein